MSFLRRLFGRQSLEELTAEADALFAEANFGSAKLTYERCLERADDAPPDVRQRLAGRIHECLDAIAKERMREAERLAAEGSFDLARHELVDALEAAASEELRAEAQRQLDGLEQRDARESSVVSPELSDEERLALIAGNWEEPQGREYESYGETLEDALLALHDNRAGEALPVLEELASSAEDPRYLWLEVARARLLTNDTEGGTTALRTFLDKLAPHEGGEARLAAHVELARLADGEGDFDGAVAEFEAAIEALEDDPRPYLWLGRFLRGKGHAGEAVDVFEAALNVMDDQQPDWRVLQELGLAHSEAGNEDKAIEMLEQVIGVLTARHHYDYPPETAKTLARLYEERGRLDRAADLFRALTKGSDRANVPHYYVEAARLLEQLEATDEARRLLQRAAALVESDPELRDQIDAKIAALPS